MKRIWIVSLGIILIAAAIIGVVIAINGSKNHNSAKKTTSDTNSAASEPTASSKKACNIFTLADAKKVLGDTAKGGSTNNQASSDDLSVSTCSYTQDTGDNVPISSSKTASLLMRAPKTEHGTTSNQNQFGPLRPADAQNVVSYGDSAYWDAQLGQLNVLKNNTWYIISYGPVTPASRSLDQTKQLADILINKM